MDSGLENLFFKSSLSWEHSNKNYKKFSQPIRYLRALFVSPRPAIADSLLLDCTHEISVRALEGTKEREGDIQ